MRRLIAILALAALAGCDVSFNAGGGNDAAEKEAAPTVRRFVNNRQHARSEPLRRHYVDFAFDYPADWAMTAQPTDGTAQNYVRVAAPLVDGYEPFAFHVGYAYGSGDAAADRLSMERALPQLAEQVGANFQNYRVVWTGPDRVGPYETQSWRFTATGAGLNGGAPAQIYGRGDLLLPPGARLGVSLLTFATSRGDEVTSADQVGETGTLKAVFDSFRLEGGAAGQ